MEWPSRADEQVAFLTEGVMRLRAVGSGRSDSNRPRDLWRGMRDMVNVEDFERIGGAEMAPMVVHSDRRTIPCPSE